VAGADGPTHHGTFDINYMLTVPGMTVTAPKDGAEMLALLRLGVNLKTGPLSLRWPRDTVPEPVPHLSEVPEIEYGSWEVLRKGGGIAVLAVGTMVEEAKKAARILSDEGLEVTVVNCRFLKPLDDEILTQILRDHTQLLTVEEGAVVNGFGAFLAREAEDRPEAAGVTIRAMGIPDRFIAHGSRAELLREIDLDAQGIAKRLRLLAGAGAAEIASPSAKMMETA
jgi:1-deoxy-D-xylulose-5-phosphate synthase